MEYFTPPSTPKKRTSLTRPGRPSLESIPFPQLTDSPSRSSINNNATTDRFIPNRSSFDAEFNYNRLARSSDESIDTSPKRNKYQEELTEITNSKDRRLIDCFDRSTLKDNVFYTPMTSIKRRDSLNNSANSPLSPKMIPRSIPSGPCRVSVLRLYLSLT